MVFVATPPILNTNNTQNISILNDYSQLKHKFMQQQQRNFLFTTSFK